MPNLTDHHRRHIIELLEQGQDLPPDYKHLLFPYRHARQHFDILNQQQSESRYFFHFLSPRDYDAFFQFLRDGNYDSFVSALDAALGENGQG